MHLTFVGQGYPRKLFNLEHFPIYGISIIALVNFIKDLAKYPPETVSSQLELKVIEHTFPG